ncbi:carbohydrate sulfotransferase 11-like [Lineus longissimus]|uniref:carbohydrate sulfotransferase 11-like n=1 Tax=Lineus longissimus TaxID=88925 RepID=UPI00315D3B71
MNCCRGTEAQKTRLSKTLKAHTGSLLTGFTLLAAFIVVGVFGLRQYVTSHHVVQATASTLRTISHQTQAEVFKQRSHRIRQSCINITREFKPWPYLSNRTFIQASSFTKLYVDETHKVVYCRTPSAASVNIHRWMLGLKGIKNSAGITAFDMFNRKGKYYRVFRKMKLSNYKVEDIRRILSNYTKVIVVRNPFERLLSLYRATIEKDQLMGTNRVFQPYREAILRQYKPGLTEDVYKNGLGIKFKEFLNFLANPRDFATLPPEVSWMRYYDLCHPCVVNYDRIVKFESFREDMSYISKERGAEKVPATFLSSPKTSAVLSAYYKEIPYTDLIKLKKVFTVDFDIFGYDFKQFMNRIIQYL